MVDETTTNNETTNSETETNPSAPPAPADTSTTDDQSQTDDESVNLGTKPQDDQSGDGTGDEEIDERTPEQIAADEERAELFGAPPEDQSYEIELPEGVELDKEALDAVAPVARKLNLSNKGLSELAGVYTEQVLPHVAKTVVANLEQDALAKRAEWEGESKDAIAGKTKLQTVGGEELSFDGKSMGEVQKSAAKALDLLAPAGFREWLEETGLGVHPQMIAFAYQAGKNITEDRDLEPPATGRVKQPAGGGRAMTDPTKFYDS